jgi:hypothetical protein
MYKDSSVGTVASTSTNSIAASVNNSGAGISGGVAKTQTNNSYFKDISVKSYPNSNKALLKREYEEGEDDASADEEDRLKSVKALLTRQENKERRSEMVIEQGKTHRDILGALGNDHHRVGDALSGRDSYEFYAEHADIEVFTLFTVHTGSIKYM